MGDEQIVALFFERNEQAIAETDVKYGRLCFSIANNILNNNQDSAECVNDSYLCVWNKIPPTHPACFKAFLCKIVRNLSLKKFEFLNAGKRNPNMIVSLSELEDLVADKEVRTDFGEEELGKLISAFLKKEKEITRNVFIRKYFFFDSISEIAKRYSFTESKVKNMLYHSRNKLKEYLKEEGVTL